MGGLRAELATPFHGIGEAGRDLLAGSRVIVCAFCRAIHQGAARAWKFAWQGETAADHLASLAVASLAGSVGAATVAGIGGTLVRLAHPYVPVIGFGVVVAWTAAAWTLAPSKGQQGHPGSDPGQAGERQLPPDTGAPAEPGMPVDEAERWLLRLVVNAVQEAVLKGRRGVHLHTLLDGIPADWTVTTLRQHCERLGVPLRRTLRIRGAGGPTWGVHADDLEAALGMPLDQALAALGGPPSAGASPGVGSPPPPVTANTRGGV